MFYKTKRTAKIATLFVECEPQSLHYGFSNPCAVNNSSFSKISNVNSFATTFPSSMMIVRRKGSFTNAIYA